MKCNVLRGIKFPSEYTGVDTKYNVFLCIKLPSEYTGVDTGGIGNHRKQLELENKCAGQPPLLCSTLLCFTNSVVRLYTSNHKVHIYFVKLICLPVFIMFYSLVLYAHVFTHVHYVLHSCV